MPLQDTEKKNLLFASIQLLLQQGRDTDAAIEEALKIVSAVEDTESLIAPAVIAKIAN